MLLFNLRGLIFFGVAFATGSALAPAIGAPDEGSVMMLAGPILTGLDAGYRALKALPFFRQADAGGAILFLPVWAWGLFWAVLGAWYHFAA